MSTSSVSILYSGWVHGKVILTSPEQSPLAPIHGQQYPCPETHALRKVHASPQVDRHQAATEAQTVEVENG